jgi:hypothetical protein
MACCTRRKRRVHQQLTAPCHRADAADAGGAKFVAAQRHALGVSAGGGTVPSGSAADVGQTDRLADRSVGLKPLPGRFGTYLLDR